MALPVGNLSGEERPVFALMDAYGWFRLIDGEHSAKIEEIVELLLSPELRPALRSWYKRCGNRMNPTAMDFREHLSKLSGENFG
jgi:hypothetical protein